jgi:hypothetical protein
MAEGGFESAQGGVAVVPGGTEPDSYPTGRGECRDGNTNPMPPWHTGPVKNTYAGGTPPTNGNDSLEGYAGESRTMP